MFDAIKGLFSPKAALPADFRDRAAKILSTSPEALAAFEASYQKHILNENFDTGNLMDKTRKDFRPDADQPAASAESFDNLKRRIVAELLDQTPYLNYDGQRLTSGSCSELIDKALPGISRDSLAVPVNAQEIMALPENFRP